MSDIGILNGPLSIAFIALLIGSPGLALGAVAGALIWRRHRRWGPASGALAGFSICLLGWLFFTDNL
jgi:Na+/proline symporter